MTRQSLRLDAVALAALAAALLAPLRPAVAQRAAAATSTDSLRPTRLAASTYLFATPAGNVVASVGSAGAIVVGVQAASLTPRLRAAVAALGERGSSAPVRFVVATAGPSAWTDGAAGWGQGGAVVIMHERLVGAVRRATVSTPAAAPASPSAGFSEVVQLFLNGEEVHVVHQPAGYSDADVSVHLERAGVLYLGDDFTTDGYPSIALDHGGTLAGLVETAEKFLDFPPTVQVVPGRGPVATTRELRAYHDMLVAVRDRVAPMVRAGQPLSAVLAARPTAAFDARWGSGPVPASEFVGQVYRSLGGR